MVHSMAVVEVSQEYIIREVIHPLTIEVTAQIDPYNTYVQSDSNQRGQERNPDEREGNFYDPKE